MTFDKAFYLGCANLNLSKVQMYQLYCDSLQLYYGG